MKSSNPLIMRIKVQTFISMKKIITLILLLFTFHLSFAQNAFIADSLDTYIHREMKKWDVPGLAIAIVKDGKVVVSKGYGTRNIHKPEQRVNENTLFQIASNTKAFTGTSLALLASEKRLSLDDKVTRYMPGFKLKDTLATSEATIRDLLCHRLGLETFQGDMLNWGSNLSRKDIIAGLSNLDPKYSFRSHFGYCNAAFLTAGEIIPLVTDTSWDDFVDYHFFRPLQMTRTTTAWYGIYTDTNACLPYTVCEGQLDRMPFANVDNLGPAASINSSVHDLSHWLLMQLDSGRYNGTQVVPYFVLQTTRTSNTIIGDQNNPYFPSKHFQTYGLGWFLEDYNGVKIIRHDGGSNGFVTTTCIVPELNLGIVVLTNTDENSLYSALRQQIIDAYMNLPYRNYSEYSRQRTIKKRMQDEDTLKKDRRLVAKRSKPELPLRAYTGTYHNPVYGDITIHEDNQKLIVYFAHHPQLAGYMYPREKSTFLCTYSDPDYGIEVIPFTIKDKEVQSVTITINGSIDFQKYEFLRTGSLPHADPIEEKHKHKKNIFKKHKKHAADEPAV